MAPMTQSTNRILDEVAKLMTDAAGAAQGLKREVEGVMKAQGEKVLSNMDVVRRDEFEAVKAMAVKAREENERLAARIATLEQEIGALKSKG
jgi:BMFP domain-containing protein YqiC